GERLAGGHLVPALAQADDADGVVDRVLLGAAPRAEVECGQADGDRPQPGDEAGVRRGHLRYDGRPRESRLVRIAALDSHPALVGRACAAVRDGLLGTGAALG